MYSPPKSKIDRNWTKFDDGEPFHDRKAPNGSFFPSLRQSPYVALPPWSSSVDQIEQFVDNKWIEIPHFKTLKRNSVTTDCIGCLQSATVNHKHPKKTTTARNATRGDVNGHTIHIDIAYLPIYLYSGN